MTQWGGGVDTNVSNNSNQLSTLPSAQQKPTPTTLDINIVRRVWNENTNLGWTLVESSEEMRGFGLQSKSFVRIPAPRVERMNGERGAQK